MKIAISIAHVADKHGMGCMIEEVLVNLQKIDDLNKYVISSFCPASIRIFLELIR